MQEWKLARISFENLNYEGFLSARYVCGEGASLDVSIDRPGNLEEMKVQDLIESLGAERDRLLGRG
ncbi:hypothetical protein NFI08_16215 [Halomonas sp. EF61]|uniref:hypothetical protein n=1 Tax=Halomonas sp. EF61 TaxID=2950869 RepID=UPI0032DEFEF6